MTLLSLRAHRRKILALLFVALFILPTEASAQSLQTHKQTITLNPFLVAVGWFNGEYERRINRTTTWGVSGSFADLEDLQYRSAKFLFRYYPQETALSRLFIGSRTGVYHFGESTGSFLTSTPGSEVVFGVGVEIGYTWLLGSERHFAISVGGGLSRLFGGDPEDGPLLPNARLVNIGVAY